MGHLTDRADRFVNKVFGRTNPPASAHDSDVKKEAADFLARLKEQRQVIKRGF